MPQIPAITAQLVHIQGPLKGQIQEFTQFPIEIGRHSSCQVRFDKDLTTISRRHAQIERQGNRFRIVDASTNGTFVNGKRIADVYLRDGDVITFSENGPKASFLTKLEAGSVPGASVIHSTSPQSPPQPPAAAPTPPPVSPIEPVPQPHPSGPSTPEPPAPAAADAGFTVGPDENMPVLPANAPLVIQFGPTLRSYNQLPVTIGSDPQCDFVIADADLAPRHVQLFFRNDEYFAKDLTGRSVVTINGRPAGSQAALAQGAELSLSDHGPTFKFLGGGRLAEVAIPSTDTSLRQTDLSPNEPNPDEAPNVPQKKSKSLFKSFFK